MPVITWSIELNDQQCVVELDHDYRTSKRAILVNGATVFKERRIAYGLRSEYSFQIDDHKCRISLQIVGFDIAYTLYVDENTPNEQQIEVVKRPFPVWGYLLELTNVLMMILPTIVIGGVQPQGYVPVGVREITLACCWAYSTGVR